MGLISRVSSRTYRRNKKNSYKMSEGRLYVRGIFTGYSRGLKTQSMNQAIVKLEGVNDQAGCAWYLGKRVAFVHKTTKIVTARRAEAELSGAESCEATARVETSRSSLTATCHPPRSRARSELCFTRFFHKSSELI